MKIDRSDLELAAITYVSKVRKRYTKKAAAELRTASARLVAAAVTHAHNLAHAHQLARATDGAR